jgi:nucleoid-associated protein YgaU
MRLVAVLSVLACLLFFFAGCPSQQPTSAESVPAAEGGPEAVTGIGAPPASVPLTPPPTSLAPALPGPGGTTYVVKPGDTLMGIARSFYGQENASLWRVIRDANRSKITGESGIKVGTELVIPPKP